MKTPTQTLFQFGGFRQSEVRKMENFLKKTCKDKVPTESVCAKGFSLPSQREKGKKKFLTPRKQDGIGGNYL